LIVEGEGSNRSVSAGHLGAQGLLLRPLRILMAVSVVPENSFEFRINKFRRSLNEVNFSC
jgi:hypothetical protein